MRIADSQSPVRAADFADESIATVRGWLAESAEPEPQARRLAAILADPDGLAFTTAFVDGVVRPAGLRVAARNFELLSRRPPAALPRTLRIVVQLGGGFAVLLPWPLVPLARRVFRRMVNHLVLDSQPKRLAASVQALREGSGGVILSPLGEGSVSTAEADRRLAEAMELLGRDDVDALSIKLSAVAGGSNLWAFDESVARIVDRLVPLYQLAAASTPPKLVTIDSELSRDLGLTLAVFTTLLDRPALGSLEAGITLPSYLPDALPAYQHLLEWAQKRRAEGGAGIVVRLVKGAKLPLERIESELNGWPLATWASKGETDSHFIRMLEHALRPGATESVRLAVASHNLFDVALAWHLAQARGVEDRLEFEMLLGMATAQRDAVARLVGGVRLYAPTVASDEFGAAVAYLVRRLEENAGGENFLAVAERLAGDEQLFEREVARFVESLDHVDDEVEGTHRVVPALVAETAEHQPLTDPAIEANRVWARQIVQRARVSTLGVAGAAAAEVRDTAGLETIVAITARAGESWGTRPAAERSALLHEVGLVLAAYRGRFVEVLLSERGMLLPQADAEVSSAIDLAHYYARRCLELEQLENARFLPAGLIVLSDGSTLTQLVSGALSALAAGSGAIIAPAAGAGRTAAVVAEALWEAGVAHGLLALAVLPTPELSAALVRHPVVDTVISPGIASPRASIIVAPSADPAQAVADVVASAFAQSGQSEASAGLVIVVGTAAETQALRHAIVDASRSLRVGSEFELATQLGPLSSPAQGEARAALTTLGPGESWLLRPEPLGDDGRLWSPGIREGSDTSSPARVPVFTLAHAETLAAAIELQNASPGGVAGLHSLDSDEIELWLEAVDSADLVVNRPTSSGSSTRQPAGGWLGSAAKTGGPNALLALGGWQPLFAEPGASVRLSGIVAPALALIEAAQPSMQFVEFDLVRAGARSDESAWWSEYGLARDLSGVDAQRTVLRYRPVDVTVRLAEGASAAQLVRVLAAAARAGARVSISSAVPVAAGIVRLVSGPASPLAVDGIVVETEARWLARVQAGQVTSTRIRLIGGDEGALAAVLGTTAMHPDAVSIAVFAAPVTTSGRLELLPFLREQSLSLTAHRYGSPDPVIGSLELGAAAPAEG